MGLVGQLWASQAVRGFVYGQLTLLLLLVVMFWLCCLRAPRNTQARLLARHTATRRWEGAATGHTETCTWLNSVVQRLYVEALAQGLEAKLAAGLLEALQPQNRPGVLGATNITKFSLGDSLPRLLQATSRETDEGLVLECEVAYSGQATLGLDTELLLNWPLSALAALPVEVVLSVAALQAHVQVVFPAQVQGRCRVSLLSDPHMDLQLLSAIGEGAKVHDLPKLQQVLDRQLRQLVSRQLVLPNSLDLPLPLLPTTR